MRYVEGLFPVYAENGQNYVWVDGRWRQLRPITGDYWSTVDGYRSKSRLQRAHLKWKDAA